MWPNLQSTADLVTFTEEILNGKLHFLCSDVSIGSFFSLVRNEQGDLLCKSSYLVWMRENEAQRKLKI